jgi:hypothetical protein
MKPRRVRIGSWQGNGKVGILARNGTSVPQLAREPRKGWAIAFEEMARCGNDAMLDGATLSLWDESEWEWR